MFKNKGHINKTMRWNLSPKKLYRTMVMKAILESMKTNPVQRFLHELTSSPSPDTASSVSAEPDVVSPVAEASIAAFPFRIARTPRAVAPRAPSPSATASVKRLADLCCLIREDTF